MTDAEIARIAALASAATPAPWYDHGTRDDEEITFISISTPLGDAVPIITTESDNRGADAAFIASAREAVPALLAALQEARADVAHARAWAAWHAGGKHGKRNPAEPLAHDLWCGFCGEFHERR